MMFQLKNLDSMQLAAGASIHGTDDQKEHDPKVLAVAVGLAVLSGTVGSISRWKGG